MEIGGNDNVGLGIVADLKYHLTTEQTPAVGVERHPPTHRTQPVIDPQHQRIHTRLDQQRLIRHKRETTHTRISGLAHHLGRRSSIVTRNHPPKPPNRITIQIGQLATRIQHPSQLIPHMTRHPRHRNTDRLTITHPQHRRHGRHRRSGRHRGVRCHIADSDIAHADKQDTAADHDENGGCRPDSGDPLWDLTTHDGRDRPEPEDVARRRRFVDNTLHHLADTSVELVTHVATSLACGEHDPAAAGQYVRSIQSVVRSRVQ